MTAKKRVSIELCLVWNWKKCEYRFVERFFGRFSSSGCLQFPSDFCFLQFFGSLLQIFGFPAGFIMLLPRFQEFRPIRPLATFAIGEAGTLAAPPSPVSDALLVFWIYIFFFQIRRGRSCPEAAALIVCYIPPPLTVYNERHSSL